MSGAYFHGVDDRVAIETYARRIGESDVWVATVNKRVNDSYPESKPDTIEGKILHDAHLLEGNAAFMVSKCLVTGTERGQSLIETIDYIKSHILGRRRCRLPEAQSEYELMEAFLASFISDLENSLKA